MLDWSFLTVDILCNFSNIGDDIFVFATFVYVFSNITEYYNKNNKILSNPDISNVAFL